jgi:haloalkane dehalogenase
MAIHLREVHPDGTPRGTVLCVHGFPETSYMWRELLDGVVAAGWRGAAPDLPGYGDSPYEGDGSWETHVAALDRVWSENDLGPVVLVVHDWGGLIGLRWALQRPEAIQALVISDTGFFPDGQWHDFAQVLRTPDEGEAFIAQWNGTMLGQLLSSVSTGITEAAVAEYAKALDTNEGRRGVLELYRSGDFDKIEDGCLARLTAPALVLWGESDPFAPLGGAHRFVRELPDAELVVVEGAGHFVYEDDPAACSAAVNAFLDARFPA